MLESFHRWYHSFSTSDTGLFVIPIVCAILGGIILKYYDIWFSRWSSARSEKKRKRTIEQLRAEIDLLRPYHKDRDKLFITTAFCAFIILGLLATGPIVASIFGTLPLVPNIGALGIACYVVRLIYRVGRFEDFEKEIKARIEKLSMQGNHQALTQTPTPSSVTTSDVPSQTEADRSSLQNKPRENWTIISGLWTVKPDGIDLTGYNEGGSAAYVWHTEQLPLPVSIGFKVTFHNATWPGLRINLFAASPYETYSASNHIQLLIPWEKEGYKMDYMHGSPRTITGTVIGLKPLPGQTYSYHLDISIDTVTVYVDGQIQFSADLRDNLEIRRHILTLPNAGSYWGFASDGSLYQISQLTIVNRDF